MTRGLFIPIRRTERLLSKSDALVAWTHAHSYVAAHPSELRKEKKTRAGGTAADPSGPAR